MFKGIKLQYVLLVSEQKREEKNGVKREAKVTGASHGSKINIVSRVPGLIWEKDEARGRGRTSERRLEGIVNE